MTTPMQLFDVSTLLRWNKEKEVTTKQGPRLLRRARPTDEFWDAWRMNQGGLKEAGISVIRDRDDENKWWVMWWRELPPEVLAQRQANHEASRAIDCDIEIPCPKSLAYKPFQRGAINYALRVFGINLQELSKFYENGGQTQQAVSSAISSQSIGQQEEHSVESTWLDDDQGSALKGGDANPFRGKYGGVLLADEMG